MIFSKDSEIVSGYHNLKVILEECNAQKTVSARGTNFLEDFCLNTMSDQCQMQ